MPLQGCGPLRKLAGPSLSHVVLMGLDTGISMLFELLPSYQEHFCNSCWCPGGVDAITTARDRTSPGEVLLSRCEILLVEGLYSLGWRAKSARRTR